MYTYRIEQAIAAAAVLHEGQTRKGDMPFPYVTHCFSIAVLLMDYTDNEDVIVAGLLHDTLEDTDYTEEELRNDFGETVAALVTTVSEPARSESSWEERKRAYEAQLTAGPSEALLIAAADKIHNMRSSIDAYVGNPLRYQHDFGNKLDERFMHYQRVRDIIAQNLESAIVDELTHVLNEYEQFLTHVKTATRL
jgi:hypothetical protein